MGAGPAPASYAPALLAAEKQTERPCPPAAGPGECSGGLSSRTASQPPDPDRSGRPDCSREGGAAPVLFQHRDSGAAPGPRNAAASCDPSPACALE